METTGHNAERKPHRRLAGGQRRPVLTGGGWWSGRAWPPEPITDRWGRDSAHRARQTAAQFAPLKGAPVVPR